MVFDRASAKRWLRTQWPTTVLRDRYDGVYSGGTWTAFPVQAESIPPAVSDQDVPCREFWTRIRSEQHLPVGVGATTEEAIRQLREAVKKLAEVDGDE